MDRYVEQFLRTEETERLFERPFMGKNIWMYLRLEVFRLIERQILRSNLVPVPYRQCFLEDCIDWSPKEQTEYEESVIQKLMGSDFLIINNKHRFVRWGEELVCPITGMLPKLYPYRFGCCTQVYNRGKFQCYDHPEDINHNRITRKSQLIFSEEELNAYVTNLALLFGQAYQIVLEQPFYTDVAAHIRYVANMMCYTDFYARLLQAVQPKAVIVSSYYATIDSLILAEADSLGIPTIEIQHGTIGNEHVAYNFLRRPKQTDCLPDYLAAYGQFERDTLRNFVEPEKMIPVGNLFLNQVRRDLSSKLAKGGERKRVLIISFNMDNGKLVQFTLDLKKFRPNWEIVYRFHPEEKIMAETLHALEEAGVICAADFQISIYSLITEADWLVGTKSTVLYEAMCFSKPSWVLQTEESDQWREAEKRMPHVLSAEDFLDKLGEDTDSLNRSAYFYRQNGEATMGTLLASLMEKGS